MSGRSAATAAARSGSALVVGIVGLTLGALGIGTVYLPYIADKDKLRGMNEESEASATGALEYERAIREMSMSGGGASAAGGAGGVDMAGIAPSSTQQQQQQQQQQPPRSNNNMWERLNQAARSPSKRPGKD
jgi:hypothetical protein